MKKTLLATTALMMYGTAATAGQTFIDVPVINYNPIKTTSEIRTPVQNCTEQLVQVDSKGNIIGTLIGAAIGGFVGSQIGGGTGNLAATAIGTLGGAAMGSNGLSNDWPLKKKTQNYKKETVCTTSYNIQHETKIVGYMVTYNFEGQSYSTRMQTQPGKSIRLMLNTAHTVQQ
tara:strand:+ start:471 stop:989 length:519 start_codon:yes stop_codon:yes gene_type:complete